VLGKLAGAPAEEFAPFAPDQAVVIVSPSERAGKVEQKVRDHLRAGTRMVWVEA
jgi:hypothetical protein